MSNFKKASQISLLDKVSILDASLCNQSVETRRRLSDHNFLPEINKLEGNLEYSGISNDSPDGFSHTFRQLDYPGNTGSRQDY